MRKASHFVVPIDFSPSMEATLSTAFALARRHGAQVDVLEVIPSRRPSRLGDDADVHLTKRQSAIGDASRLSESIESAKLRDIHVRTIAFRGDATKVIASHAQLAKATLIIIDKNYGTSAWRRNPRIVNELARSSPAPVLVLPARRKSEKDEPPSFRHILSAVDLTVASAVAMRTVLDLVRRTGARLTLVHALNAPNHMVFSGGEGFKARTNLAAQTASAAERLRQKIPADVDIQVDARVTTGDPHRAILTVAAEVGADLVVMGVAPRRRLDEILFGSTLRRVLRAMKIPLLVLPVPAGAHKWLDETDRVELPLPARTRQRARR